MKGQRQDDEAGEPQQPAAAAGCRDQRWTHSSDLPSANHRASLPMFGFIAKGKLRALRHGWLEIGRRRHRCGPPMTAPIAHAVVALWARFREAQKRRRRGRESGFAPEGAPQMPTTGSLLSARGQIVARGRGYGALPPFPLRLPHRARTPTEARRHQVGKRQHDRGPRGGSPSAERSKEAQLN